MQHIWMKSEAVLLSCSCSVLSCLLTSLTTPTHPAAVYHVTDTCAHTFALIDNCLLV